MEGILAELDALIAEASPLPWAAYRWRVAGEATGDIAHFFMSQPPCNDNAAYTVLAVNHLRPLVAALFANRIPHSSGDVCVAECGACQLESALAALAENLAKLKEA